MGKSLANENQRVSDHGGCPHDGCSLLSLSDKHDATKWLAGKHLKFTGMGIDIKSANANFAAILGRKFGWGGRIRKLTGANRKPSKTVIP